MSFIDQGWTKGGMRNCCHHRSGNKEKLAKMSYVDKLTHSLHSLYISKCAFVLLYILLYKIQVDTISMYKTMYVI